MAHPPNNYQNRLFQKQYPDSTQVNYTYDAAGRMTQVIDPSGTYTFTYDNMNRLTQADANYAFDSAGTLTVKYGYDAASNRNSMTDPQNLGTVYTYDVLNRLGTLAFNGQSPGFGFGYDALSRRNSLTRPNGINTTYGYDPASSLLSVLHKLGATTLDGATYTYDNAENRKTRTDKRTNTTLNYTFDPLYQLQTAKQGATTKESYTYDAVGNRLTSLGVSPYQYNPSNQLTSTPSTTYTYDNNGNTKTKLDASGTTTYNWDFENRLTSVVLPGSGGTVSFKYDPFGRRVQKSGPGGTTDYLYDGPNLLEETDQSGSMLARFTQNGMDESLAQLRSSTTSYYQEDGLGSTTSLSNPAGALTNTYTYDSFGKLTASSGTIANAFQYTGREFESETGIYEYRARYYDPAVGRFLSEDPLKFRSGVNFYAYVGNDSVNLIDPSGLQPGWWNGVMNWLVPPVPPPPIPHWPAPPSPTLPFKCSFAGECDFTPDMSSALDCFRICIGRQPIVTCGRGRHKETDPHSRGEAADMGRGSNPWLTTDQTKHCFGDCFNGGYGQEEYNDDGKTTHYHLQIGPGVGGATGFSPTVHAQGK